MGSRQGGESQQVIAGRYMPVGSPNTTGNSIPWESPGCHAPYVAIVDLSGFRVAFRAALITSVALSRRM